MSFPFHLIYILLKYITAFFANPTAIITYFYHLINVIIYKDSRKHICFNMLFEGDTLFYTDFMHSGETSKLLHNSIAKNALIYDLLINAIYRNIS